MILDERVRRNVGPLEFIRCAHNFPQRFSQFSAEFLANRRRLQTMTLISRSSLLLLALLSRAALAQVIRINVGGGQFTDPTGNVWQDDAYFNSGAATWDCPKAIANTDNDNLYCTYRWFDQARPYLYQIPVANGNYKVRLHFAEM